MLRGQLGGLGVETLTIYTATCADEGSGTFMCYMKKITMATKLYRPTTEHGMGIWGGTQGAVYYNLCR